MNSLKNPAFEKHTLLGWSTFLISGLFLLYEFTLRAFPGLLVPELLRAFHTNATQIGLLAAITGYVYVIMQLPVAIAVSRRYLRLLYFIMFLICAIGALCFAWSPSLLVADIARGIIGLSSAFAWVGLLKIGELFLPSKIFPMVSALLGSFAVLGAAAGGLILIWLFSIFFWRDVTFAFAILGFICVILLGVFFFLTRKTVTSTTADFKINELGKLLCDIFKNWRSYILIFTSFFSAVPILAFSLLWAIPFLSELYHVSSLHAALINAAFFLGIFIGSPIIGIFLSFFNLIKSTIITGLVLVLVLLTLIIYMKLPIWLTVILLFFTGIASSTQLQFFTMAQKHYPKRLSVLMLTIVNIASTIGGAVFQPILGKLLDTHHLKVHHMLDYTYTVSDYRHAMIVVPTTMIIALLFGFFLPFRIKQKNN